MIPTEFEVNFADFEWDFNGIELFLQQILYGATYDSYTLTQIVMGDAEKKIPNPCTSVIKMPPVNISQMEGEIADWDWEEDVYGVGTILDFNSKVVSGLAPFQQITQFIVDTCSDPAIRKSFLDILSSQPVGLLINQHVLNLPLELTAKFHENLLVDYREQVAKNGLPFFNYILLFSTAVFPHKNNNASSSRKKKQEPIFSRAEDVFFYRHCKLNFHFVLKHDLSHEQEDKAITMNEDGVREGIVMMIPTQEWEPIIKNMVGFLTGQIPLQ